LLAHLFTGRSLTIHKVTNDPLPSGTVLSSRYRMSSLAAATTFASDGKKDVSS
jgi:hypothetical protein